MTAILKKAGLTQQEERALRAILDNDNADDSFYDSTMFEKLFEYFWFVSGIMPYSVAKARTDVPDDWIMSYLQDRRG